MIGRDGALGLACLAGSAALLVASRGLPHPALVPIGPAFYPRILLTGTALLGAALVAADLVGRRPAVPPRPASYRLVVLTFAIFIAYVLLLPWLGYRVATFLFVGTLQAVLEPPRGRRWALVLAVASATALGTWLVFERYLAVLLPRGALTGL